MAHLLGLLKGVCLRWKLLPEKYRPIGTLISLSVYIFLPLALGSISSCSTIEEKSLQDGEAVTTSIYADRPLPKSLTEFWDPGQRQSQAGFYYLMGEYLSLKGEPERASPFLNVAYDLDPNSFLGAKMLANRAQNGHQEIALPDVRRMVLLYPKAPAIRNLYGEILAINGQWQEAASEFEQTIRLDDRFLPAYVNQIAALQALRRLDEAYKVAVVLTKQKPGLEMGWSLTSRILLLQGKKSEALLPAKKAYELESDSPETIVIYAYTLELNGKTREALPLYEKLFRMSPGSEDILARSVKLYRQIGGEEEALRMLSDMSGKTESQSIAIIIQRIFLLWELGREGEAATQLRQILPQFPQSDQIKYLAGLAFEKVSSFDEALAAYAAISDGTKLGVHGKIRMLMLQRRLKNYEASFAVLQQLLNRPDVEEEFFVLGGALATEFERFDQALSIVSHGVKRFPQSIRLLFLRGVYEEQMGELDATINTMREVIAKDPSHSSAYNYLGYLYAEQGENLDEAEALIRKALSLKPDDGYFMDSLGWVYFKKEKYEEATKMLLKALEFSPDEGVILEHLADVKYAQEKIQEAKQLYLKALEMRLDKRDRERIKKKLTEYYGDNQET